MRRALGLAVLAAAISTVNAVHQGFNCGAFFADNSAKTQADFEEEFRAAQSLTNAPGNGFTSARLYTMIVSSPPLAQHHPPPLRPKPNQQLTNISLPLHLQWGTKATPITAIPAAIATNTTLLLGIWCSAPDASTATAGVTNELAALKTAIATYGTNLTSLVVGLAVGSEDLYRTSETGKKNNAGAGSDAATLVSHIKRVRDSLRETPLVNVPVGHVDTWTEWVEGRNKIVVDAVDWVDMDAYGYWQTMVPNSVDRGKGLFDDAMQKTREAVGGKPVWVTETGFPVSGPASRDAVPSVEGAKRFWDAVGCALFGKVDVWWFLLRDVKRGTLEPSFGIVGEDLGRGPLFDVSCKGVGEKGGEEEEACDAV